MSDYIIVIDDECDPVKVLAIPVDRSPGVWPINYVDHRAQMDHFGARLSDGGFEPEAYEQMACWLVKQYFTTDSEPEAFLRTLFDKSTSGGYITIVDVEVKS